MYSGPYFFLIHRSDGSDRIYYNYRLSYIFLYFLIIIHHAGELNQMILQDIILSVKRVHPNAHCYPVSEEYYVIWDSVEKQYLGDADFTIESAWQNAYKISKHEDTSLFAG